MVQIDFSQLPCFTDIRKSDKAAIDVKFDFANAMYMRGSGIDMGALAMKIYNSTGREYYDKKECALILNMARAINAVLFDSLNALIQEQETA